jgi:hypothetical protein
MKPPLPRASRATPEESKGVPDCFYFAVIADSVPGVITKEFHIPAQDAVGYSTFNAAAKAGSDDAVRLPDGKVCFIVQAMAMATKPKDC